MSILLAIFLGFACSAFAQESAVQSTDPVTVTATSDAAPKAKKPDHKNWELRSYALFRVMTISSPGNGAKLSTGVLTPTFGFQWNFLNDFSIEAISLLNMYNPQGLSYGGDDLGESAIEEVIASLKFYPFGHGSAFSPWIAVGEEYASAAAAVPYQRNGTNLATSVVSERTFVPSLGVDVRFWDNVLLSAIVAGTAVDTATSITEGSIKTDSPFMGGAGLVIGL